MNIYEIDQAIMNLCDTETGEIIDLDAFLALQMERKNKIENTVLYIKNLKAEASAIESEEKALKARRRTLENKAVRAKELVGYVLEGEKFKTPRCTVNYRKVTSLDVSDPAIAAKWLTENGHVDLVTYSEPTLDKRGVRSLLDTGTEIPGCSVSEYQSMILG